MKKLRNVMIFIVTVGMIALCAMLPKIYAQIQDSMSDEKVEYADIKTVSFEKELNLVEKLFLLRDGLRVSVSSENMTKTEDEIRDCSYMGLDYYYASDLLYTYLKEAEFSAEPMFFFYNDAADISSSFWLVEYTMGDGSEKISLWIDDETGLVLLVNYESAYQMYEEEMIDEYLYHFYSIYLSYTELLESSEELIVYEDGETNANAGNTAIEEYAAIQDSSVDDYNFYDKKHGSANTLTLEDPIYGKISLYFYVYTNGFFVNLA